MTVTFNHMIDRLRENIEKQNQFVSDASHELKTPLTVIRSYSNLLRRRGIKMKKLRWMRSTPSMRKQPKCKND